MTVTSVSKLRASLSEFLRRLKAGEEVLVTERGRAIARLDPPASSVSRSESLREMERQEPAAPQELFVERSTAPA